MSAAVPARSFGTVAEAYDRGRPGYPREAAAWLTGGEGLSVVELGAGTGKLTETLVGLGHDVLATDPDQRMLEVLRRRLPEIRTAQCGAEAIAADDRSADVVVCAQSLHWCDLEQALPEIARVLKPGGHLATVWNERDERIPWVRRLGAILRSPDQLRDPSDALAASGLFGEPEQADFGHWQQIDRESVLDLALSRSSIASLDDDARAARLEEVRAFYADYGRGMDGMQLPYRARCQRAAVGAHALPEPTFAPASATSADPADPADTPAVARVLDDTGTLLISFR